MAVSGAFVFHKHILFFFYIPAMFSKVFFSRVIEDQELFGKGLQKEQECKESE